MKGNIKEQSVHREPAPDAGKNIENKVANILAYTRSFGEAAAKKNDDEKVMTLLRFAQNFAESGNLESALIQLQRAYAINPLHPEISAVERSLKQKHFGETAVNNTIQSDSLPLHSESAAPVFDLKLYSERIGVNREPAQIKEFLAKAEYHCERNEHIQAQEMIARAYQLDPFNSSIQRIERTISASTSSETKLDLIIREARSHLSQNNFESARNCIKQAYVLDPFNEKLQQLDETITLSLKKELNPTEQCLLAAHRYFHSGEYRKAKEEIHLGYLIDPLNQQLAALEEKIDRASMM